MSVCPSIKSVLAWECVLKIPNSVSFDLHKFIAFMLEQLLIETYLMNLCSVRRDSTDAALTL